MLKKINGRLYSRRITTLQFSNIFFLTSAFSAPLRNIIITVFGTLFRLQKKAVSSRRFRVEDPNPASLPPHARILLMKCDCVELWVEQRCVCLGSIQTHWKLLMCCAETSAEKPTAVMHLSAEPLQQT